MTRGFFLFVGVLAAIGCAMGLSSGGRLMPVEYELPTHLWVRDSRAESDLHLKFTVQFNQHNMDVLHKTLMQISDPQSATYRQWLTKEYVDELTAPKAVVRARVLAFLTQRLTPFLPIEDMVDHLRVMAPIAKIEALFGMEFWRFTSVSNPKDFAIVSPSSYTLPAEIEGEVLFLTGLTGFPVPKERRMGARRPLEVTRDDTAGKVAPSVLSRLYGVPASTLLSDTNSSLCLAEFQNDHSYSPSDLVDFDQQNELAAARMVQIIGGLSFSPPDGEATLDVQYGSACANNASVWYWSNAGWMYDFSSALYARSPAPYVVSMSWGWTETNQCQITSCNGASNAQYIQATDNNWMKITSRGTTLVASSGDQGAPGDANPNCLLGSLSVIYPSVSPYVLAVGATALKEPSIQPPPPAGQNPFCTAVGCSQSSTEIVCSYPDALITSGGGFSQTEPISAAPWQQAQVQSYVSKNGALLPPQSLWPASGRAVPDVSALGHNYVIIMSGSYELVDGTSCSAPYWAGLIALLNDGLFKHGKQPLGFINPTLYSIYNSNPQAFNDIVGGTNACTEKCCAKYGYPVVAGWDAATGLGSPNYPALYQAIVGTAPPQ